jgi:flagella basal body P-ring formation protein FlgA
LFVGAAAYAAAVVVSLRTTSTVSGPGIRLGEIADLHGKDTVLIDRLRTIEVGRAPLPGLSRTLDVSYLKARLRQAQVNLNSMILDLPSTVTVTTASQEVSGEVLVATARDAILAARPKDADRLAIRPTGALPAALVLPAGTLQLKVRNRPAADLHGTVSATVEAWVDGALVRSVNVPLRVSILCDMVVAARPIGRMQFIDAEDVRVEARESPAGQDPLRDLAAAIGRQATRNIAPGEPVLATAVNDPPLVRRGDIVLLTAEGRGVRAVTRGEARQDGKAGDIIRVRSLSSLREVYGQVEAERLVRVAF